MDKKTNIKEKNMVNEADVCVKNNLTGDIRAIRYCLPGGNIDLDISIAPGSDESVHLVRTETYLVIEPPDGDDPADCRFIVSNEELLTWSATDGHWTVEIKLNNLPPETPTTANVDVGPKET